MTRKSRFSELLIAERPPESEPAIEAPPSPPETSPAEKRPGRPRGRRSSADYQSVTCFLHSETYRRTRAELVETGGDFGALVDELLRGWLARR
jgi:hypothetical protein